MKKKKIIILSVQDSIYEWLKKVSEKQGITIQEAIRRNLEKKKPLTANK